MRSLAQVKKKFLLGKYEIKKKVSDRLFRVYFLVEDEDHNEFVIQRISQECFKNKYKYYLEDPEKHFNNKIKLLKSVNSPYIMKLFGY